MAQADTWETGRAGVGLGFWGGGYSHPPATAPRKKIPCQSNTVHDEKHEEGGP